MKIRTLIILTLLYCLLFGCSNAEEVYKPKLFPIETKVKGNRAFGYIDQKGNIVIKPQYSFAEPFRDELANVEIYKRGYGFIDEKGKMVIEPIYRYAHDFSEGLAAVNKGEDWGFIDKQGNVVIDFIIGNTEQFSDGLAVVSNMKGKDGYINKKGEMVLEPQFDYFADFHDGLAAVAKTVVDENGNVRRAAKYGYIDKTGKLITELIFGTAKDFSEGYAVVHYYLGIDEESKPVIIDKTGKVAIDLENAYEYKPFTEGLSCTYIFEKDNGYYGYIDYKGNIVIKPQFYNADQFYDGIAAVSLDGENFGGIDKKGKLVIDYRFKNKFWFRNGVAEVIETKTGKKGYIDKTGKFIYVETE